MTGKQIQNYQIGSHLGQGGMGTVYRATDIILGREVALKMLHSPMISQPQVLERFKKEAQVLARLLHPNIAVIYNLIEQDGQHFMVMEYVEGKDLDGLLKKHGRIPPMAVTTAFIQALEGLHHAHKKGIFHRDIKPSNLILTPDGTVKLMDFGIAKVAGEQRLTQVNRVIGTVEFLAPELIEGKDPSAASDVYAAGMTMYELLCGKLPFESNTDYNLMQDILKKKPVSPDKLNQAVPPSLAAIVMKALEKKPEQRFADAKAFQQALVAAFPAAREADITYLFSNAVVPLTTYSNVRATGTREAVKPGSGNYLRPAYLLRMLNLPAMMNLPSLAKIKLPSMLKATDGTSRRNLLIGVAVAVIILVTTVLVLTREEASPADKLAAADEVKPVKPADYAVQQQGPPVQQQGTPDTTQRGPLLLTLPEETKEATGKDAGTAEKKKQPAKKEGNETKNQEPAPPPVIPEKEPEKPAPVEEPAPKPSGSMTLPGRIEVLLYLREPINENFQTGQGLTFTVTSPVVVNGKTIIERGALASGRISNMGNKKISVVLQMVNGINGQRLPLQQIELSGRTNEMISNRSYSAYLKKGTVVNY